jgi:hypothetical protein
LEIIIKESITKFRKCTFWIYWILTASVGWSFRIVDLGFINQWKIRSMADLPTMILLSSIGGLVGGLIIGLGQQHILHRFLTKESHNWWWKTVIGNSLLAPFGIGIITLIAWISTTTHGDVFLPESQTMNISLYPSYLFFGGIILGIVQWSGLRNIIGKRGWKEAFLWILGIWTSIGLGIIAGMITTNLVFHMDGRSIWKYLLEHAVTGIMYGVVTGAIFLILQNRSTNHRE